MYFLTIDIRYYLLIRDALVIYKEYMSHVKTSFNDLYHEGLTVNGVLHLINWTLDVYSLICYSKILNPFFYLFFFNWMPENASPLRYVIVSFSIVLVSFLLFGCINTILIRSMLFDLCFSSLYQTDKLSPKLDVFSLVVVVS